MCNSTEEQENPRIYDHIICLVVIVIMAIVIVIETLYIFRKKLPCQRTSSNSRAPESEFQTTSTDWNPYYGGQEYYQEGQITQVNDKNQYYDYRN